MDVDTTADIVDALAVAELGAEEGGDMECSHWSLSLSGQALSSIQSTVSGRLSILTDTGTITIGIRAIDPVTPSALANMIGSLMQDMVFTQLDTGSEGDDE